MDYDNLLLKLQKCIRFDEVEKGFILDIEEKGYEEIKQYFKFDSPHQAFLLLKVWIQELKNQYVEKETDEDSLLEFFRIKYFMTTKDRLIEEGNPIKGVGESL